jgi:hypothetical protein
VSRSGKRPAPTREHHDTFCVTEGWTLVRGATGQPVAHHRTYELGLWDGRVLRTRISRPVNGSNYGKSVWSHILREQLEVTADQFWACVIESVLPDRGAPAPARADAALPLYLVVELGRYGVDAAHLEGLNAGEAQALLTARIESASAED